MKKVYITYAKRTAIGSFLGSLSSQSPSDMGAVLVKNLLQTTKIEVADVDEVIMGNVLPAGQGQNIARQVLIKSGLPEDRVGYTVNMVCGSGLKSVMNAFETIGTGINKLVIAGGTESMSQAPYLVPKTVREGVKMGNFQVLDHMIFDALTDCYNNYHMGITAENVGEKYGISRGEQDAFAYESQRKASEAIKRGLFADEIVPVEIKSKKETFLFEVDEYPRLTSLEKLAALKPVFKKDGTVTAGNSSGINDGAAVVLVCDEEMLKKYNLNPLAEIVSVGQGGVSPSLMGMGPVSAIRQALKNASLSLKEMEALELNEAFAAQSLGVVKELCREHKVDEAELSAKANLFGGAIALGHPVGSSGTRVLVTLLNILKKKNLTYGLASLCIGGGMGVCAVVKRL